MTHPARVPSDSSDKGLKKLQNSKLSFISFKFIPAGQNILSNSSRMHHLSSLFSHFQEKVGLPHAPFDYVFLIVVSNSLIMHIKASVFSLFTLPFQTV